MGRRKLRESREMSDGQRERNEIGERLCDAAFKGRLADVNAIIVDYGNDRLIMNIKNTKIISPLFGRTPLICAIQGGHLEIVQALLKVPAVDCHLSESTEYYRPLPEAAKRNHVEIVKALLALPDVDVNTVDANLSKPLMFAAKFGNQELAEIFLSRGANRKLRNKFGENAEMLANQAGFPVLAKMIHDGNYSPRLFTQKPHDTNMPQQSLHPSLC